MISVTAITYNFFFFCFHPCWRRKTARHPKLQRLHLPPRRLQSQLLFEPMEKNTIKRKAVVLVVGGKAVIALLLRLYFSADFHKAAIIDSKNKIKIMTMFTFIKNWAAAMLHFLIEHYEKEVFFNASQRAIYGSEGDKTGWLSKLFLELANQLICRLIHNQNLFSTTSASNHS